MMPQRPPARAVTATARCGSGRMTVARSGRFAGARAPAFVALNSSLALDWRLWPEDIEGSVAHARRAARRRPAERGRDRGHRGWPRRRRPRDRGRARSSPPTPTRTCTWRSSAGSRSSPATPAPGCTPAAAATTRWSRTCGCTCAASSSGQDAALAALQAVLARAADHVETVLPAYTHLQRAQVTSLAQHLLAYFWMLERDRRTLRGGPAGVPRAAARRRRRGRPRLRPRPRGESADASASSASPRTPSTRSPTATSPSTIWRRPPQLGAHLSRARRRARAVGERRVRLRAPAGRLQRRLEHHAAEEEPRCRRADAGRRSAARPPTSAACSACCTACRSPTTPTCARTSAISSTRSTASTDCCRSCTACSTEVDFDEARMAAACDPFLAATDVADYLVERACRSARRTTSPAASCAAAWRAARLSRRSPATRTCALSRRRLDEGYYALHDPAAQLARKRSRGGSAPARVREQSSARAAARRARRLGVGRIRIWSPSGAGTREVRPGRAYTEYVLRTRRAHGAPPCPRPTAVAPRPRRIGSGNSRRGPLQPLPSVLLRPLRPRGRARPHRLHLLVRRCRRTHRRDRGLSPGRHRSHGYRGKTRAQRRDVRAARPPLRLLHLRHALLRQRRLRGRRAQRPACCCGRSSRERGLEEMVVRRGIDRAAPAGQRAGAARPGARHRPRAERSAACWEPPLAILPREARAGSPSRRASSRRRASASAAATRSRGASSTPTAASSRDHCRRDAAMLPCGLGPDRNDAESITTTVRRLFPGQSFRRLHRRPLPSRKDHREAPRDLRDRRAHGHRGRPARQGRRRRVPGARRRRATTRSPTTSRSSPTRRSSPIRSTTRASTSATPTPRSRPSSAAST